MVQIMQEHITFTKPQEHTLHHESHNTSGDTAASARKKRVLLDRFPSLFSPRVLLLILLYSLAFTLLLLGLKMLQLEHRIQQAGRELSSLQNTSATRDTLLYQQESSEEIQQGIAENIIRLHVIANSDSDDDQALKLKVRDGIITRLQSSLADAGSMAQARSELMAENSAIQKEAERIIQNEGYDYPVRVSLEQLYFPVKEYGDLTFPAGNYEALCIEIGQAAGRNWWCVLFPSLCFVDETCAVVPDSSKEKLEDALTEEEYQSLQETPCPDSTDSVEVHMAIWDFLR